MYRKYEQETGAALEEAARKSCIQAAAEEKELVVEKLQELVQELPQEIVDEIYPEINNICGESNNTKCDQSIGNIVNIIVSYDMGWSRRGTGKSYDSLNGYGAVIGFLSGKVLDYRSRNRKCRLCDKGHAKDDHDCRQNHQGSSKSMEAAVGAELVNKSQVFKEVGVNARVIIGDEDSSTIASIRQGSQHRIFKLADTNHLKKHFTGDLYNLKPRFSELKKKGVIDHLKKCFSYAVARNKGKAAELAAEIRNIPDHMFNRHENCTDHCYTVSGISESQSFILKDADLFRELYSIYSKYANNASKFCIAASSQANESFNGIMAHKAPQYICYTLLLNHVTYRLSEKF